MELCGISGLSAYKVYLKAVFSLVFLRRFNHVHNDQLIIIAQLKEAETEDEKNELIELLTLDKFKTVNFELNEIIAIFKKSTNEEKNTMFLESLTNLTLSDEELLILLSVHSDANGIEYSRHNIGNLPVSDIFPLCIDTLISCSNLDIDTSLLNVDELNFLVNKRIPINDTASDILASNADIKTKDLISLSIKRFFKRFRVEGAK